MKRADRSRRDPSVGRWRWVALGMGVTLTLAFSPHPAERPAGTPASPNPATPATPSVATSAAVTLRLNTASVPAGRCLAATILVSPNKSGEQVQVQRRRGSSWRTTAVSALDAGSSALIRLCFAFADMGRVQLRARWPQQDATSTEGMSGAVGLSVGQARWMRKIRALVGRRSVSISIYDGARALYRLRDTVPRAPASNEKLLLSMALLDRLGPDRTIPTRAAAVHATGPVVHGDLWILGGGDPEVTPGRLGALAKAVRAAGIRRVTGRVMGSTGYFARDWFAPGWKPDFPAQEVALPTALTFEGNTARGRHIRDPELRAATAFTRRLRSAGIRVGGRAGAGPAPSGARSVASVPSVPLSEILHHQNVASINFDAEVLGKLLGARTFGPPGTIAKGAAAIRAFARANGVRVSAFDGSGLSYADRVSALGIVRLLRVAQSAPWGGHLLRTLPHPGQGTLKGRLSKIHVRAKTGSLTNISALSGWVLLTQTGTWAPFSILSHGSVSALKHVEDKIVRTVARSAS